MSASIIDRVDDDVDAPEPSGRGLRITLIALIAIAALVIAGGAGWLLHGGSSSTPGASSVDAGFAQDMSTHHIQAVTMAGIERDNTTNKRLYSLSFDIETGQQFQVGVMSGWLNDWGVSQNSAHPMAWMGSQHMAMGPDGLMPGMATPSQIDQLSAATGKAQDILFLQLMIRHHQGGLPMERYAREHASQKPTRDLAQSMINAQSSEIIEMEGLLRGLGGQPLPPPL